MASRKDMLSKMKMPAQSVGAEEADLDLESLGLDEEVGAEDELGMEEEGGEDIESPLLDVEDDVILQEAIKRGLIPDPAQDDGEPVDEDGEDVDEDEIVPPEPTTGSY